MLRRTMSRGSTLRGNGVIGIRREDKNVWERRVPLTPGQVEKLLSRGKVSKVIVQPSTTRAFDNRSYEEAGAEVNDDLSEANTICAVKEVPAQLLLPNRTYMFFSHTIKAQLYNMPLLDTILKKNIRLIDYEKIVNEDGRMVKFGPYAGYAGCIDTLHAMGLALLTRGFATPFLHLSMSKEYSSLEVARQDLRDVGEAIRTRGLPSAVCPLTVAITGNGAVSQGAQQILHHLPCKYVDVEDLPRIWSQTQKDTKNIFVVVVRSNNMVTPRDPAKKFCTKEYYENPDEFIPIFHERVAPYVHCLINGMYWESRFPRLLTKAQARELHEQGRFPLLCLGDITCDPEGSVEFFVKATTIQNPFYAYDVKSDEVFEMHQFNGRGVIIDGVDHMPAEFPKEASTDFGNGLVPLIEKVSVSNGTLSLSEQAKELGPELFNAVITHNGELTPRFKYIAKLRAEKEQQLGKKKKITVFGGGMTSGPCVRYLMSNQDNIVTLIDSNQSNLDQVMNNFGRELGLSDSTGGLRTVRADVSSIDDYVKSIIGTSDVIVSMLPAHMHASIAEHAIDAGVPMVTASYISPQMEALRERAEQKEALIVNELGLDPGIDIMTSAKLIRDIRREGGVVTSYVSLCGALVAPENSDGPLGYKFSWSPRGVLTAATRPTRFFLGGKWHEIPGKYLYHTIQPHGNYAGLNLFWVPNGNAEKYAKCYELTGPEVQTVLRGTLRYHHYAPVITSFQLLGLLREDLQLEELLEGNTKSMTWPQLLRTLVGGTSDLRTDIGKYLGDALVNVRAEVQALEGFRALQSLTVSSNAPVYVPLPLQQEIALILKNFDRLGLLSEAQVVPKTRQGIIIDSLCATLMERLSFLSHERDYIMMIHRISAFFPNTGKKKLFKATLSMRGKDLTNTATALTVGLPVGITAQLILNKGLTSKSGLMIPTDPELYNPVLRTLAAEGITMHEEVREV